MSKRALVATLAGSLAVLLPAAARAEGPPFVVAAPRPLKLPQTAEKVDVLDEVARTLKESGCEVRQVCRGDGCWAIHPSASVLLVEAAFPPGEYSCTGSVELRSPGGSVRFRQSLDKDSCPAAFFVRDAKQAAATACADAKKIPMTAEFATKAESRPPGSRPDAWRGWVPLTLILTGMVAAGSGAALWGVDGKPTGCHRGEMGEICTRTLRTKGLGIPLIGAGVIAIGAGSLFIAGVF